MNNKVEQPTRVDALIRFFQNNKYTATLILSGIIIIALAKVTESGDNVLRRLGLLKTYDVNQATNRGKFSSALIENAWNRMFWLRSYTERIRLNATPEEQKIAWQKYIDASEKWSSNIMNYYLGLDEYYPNTNKRQILEGTIQPQFIKANRIISRLKYSLDTMSVKNRLLKIDSIQAIVNDINPDFYSLIDQSLDKK